MSANTAGPWSVVNVTYSSLAYPENTQLRTAQPFPLHDQYVVVYNEVFPKSAITVSSASSPAATLASPASTTRTSSTDKRKGAKGVLTPIVESEDISLGAVGPFDKASVQGRIKPWKHTVEDDPRQKQLKRTKKQRKQLMEQRLGKWNEGSTAAVLGALVVKTEMADAVCTICRKHADPDQNRSDGGYCRACYLCPVCGTGTSVVTGPPTEKPCRVWLTCNSCDWKTAPKDSIKDLQDLIRSFSIRPALSALRDTIKASLRPFVVSGAGGGSTCTYSTSKLLAPETSTRQALSNNSLSERALKLLQDSEAGDGGQSEFQGAALVDGKLQLARAKLAKKLPDLIEGSPLLTTVAQSTYKRPKGKPYPAEVPKATAAMEERIGIGQARSDTGYSSLAAHLTQKGLFPQRVPAPEGQPKVVPQYLVFGAPLVQRPKVSIDKDLEYFNETAACMNATPPFVDFTILNKDLCTPMPPTVDESKRKYVSLRHSAVASSTSSYRAHRLLPQVVPAWTLTPALAPTPAAAAAAKTAPAVASTPAKPQTMFFFLWNKGIANVTVLDVQIHHTQLAEGYSAKLFAATHIGSPKKGLSTTDASPAKGASTEPREKGDPLAATTSSEGQLSPESPPAAGPGSPRGEPPIKEKSSSFFGSFSLPFGKKQDPKATGGASQEATTPGSPNPSFASPSASQQLNDINLISSANGSLLTPFNARNPVALPFHVDSAVALKVEKSVGALQQEGRIVFGITVFPTGSAASGGAELAASLTTHNPTLSGRQFVVLQIGCRLSVPLEPQASAFNLNQTLSGSTTVTSLATSQSPATASNKVQEPTEMTYFAVIELGKKEE